MIIRRDSFFSTRQTFYSNLSGSCLGYTVWMFFGLYYERAKSDQLQYVLGELNVHLALEYLFYFLQFLVFFFYRLSLPTKCVHLAALHISVNIGPPIMFPVQCINKSSLFPFCSALCILFMPFKIVPLAV